jgi:hypothetical protein
VLSGASYICVTNTWPVAAQAQIGDSNDSNRGNPRRDFTSHIRVTGRSGQRVRQYSIRMGICTPAIGGEISNIGLADAALDLIVNLGQSGRTLTRSASLTDYEHVAHSVGLDPLRMLRIVGLPATVFDDPNMMISADSVGWLLEESARLSGQEAFGLLLAETRSLANLGMVALVLREEPTLRAVMQSSVRYARLHNAGVQLRLDDAGDIALLHVGANMQGGTASGARQSKCRPASYCGCAGP